MRRGVIFGLRWCDVDFTNQTFSIKQTLQRLKGKGLVFRKATKTDGSPRSIAISDAVIKMLKNEKSKQEQQKLKLGSYYQDHDLVMANDDGSPINIDYLSREFGRLVKRLDIPYVRFHDLRHTHATRRTSKSSVRAVRAFNDCYYHGHLLSCHAQYAKRSRQKTRRLLIR